MSSSGWGPEHGNSSLEAGTYSTTLSYYYGTAPAGGGGSGLLNQGGTGDALRFDTPSVTAVPNATTTGTFNMTNTAADGSVLNVTEETSVYPGCEYIAVQASLISTDFEDQATTASTRTRQRQ
jgi:hypothetical protein